MVHTMTLQDPSAHHECEPAWLTALQPALSAIDPLRAAVLRRRLRTHGARLHARLQGLYGQQAGFHDFTVSLLTAALKHAAQREEALWQLDLAREARPEWLHAGLTGYCAYVDKFAGNLQGVAAQVPYLQELGIGYLHLLPFLKAGQGANDGGFAVASFADVEPSLGTMADLQVLCADLRQAGISLCSDLVLNHVSHDHAWARAAREGDAAFLAYFHWRPSAEAVAAEERHLKQVFPATAPGNFTFIEERQAWVWTTFYPYQWDLNWAHAPVFRDMAEAMLNLANHGVEAFRLDSTGYLWKREGTDCQNQPEAHAILQALRALCDIVAPACLLKAEAIMPTQALPPYFGLGELQGPQCHTAYHSSLMAASWVALAEGREDIVREVLRHTPDLPKGCAWLTYVRCHDDIGWNVLRPELTAMGRDAQASLLAAVQHYAGRDGQGARGASFQASDDHAVHGTNGMTLALTGLPPGAPAGDATERALARMGLLQSLSFFVGGLPLVYMGDELGQDNVSEAELTVRAGPDGRELHRPVFDEVAARQRHDPSTLPGRCFQQLASLARWRRRHLAEDRPVSLRVFQTAEPGVLVLGRGQALGLFNFTGQPVQVDLRPLAQPWPLWQVADTCRPLDSELVALPAFGQCWLTSSTDLYADSGA